MAMKRILTLAVAAAMLLGPPSRDAFAQTTTPQQVDLNLTAYPATFENVVKVALKLHALNTLDDAVIDDFAKISYCDVFQRYYQNEFEWRKVRTALRQEIQDHIREYPTTLFLERKETFGMYDFPTGTLLMQPDSVMHDVTQLMLASAGSHNVCYNRTEGIVQQFVAELDKPMNIDGIKMSEDEAQAVVSGLTQIGYDEEKGGPVRVGYGRYVVTLDGSGHPPPGVTDAIYFLGRLRSVTFFEDPFYHKPFWSGLASVRDSVAGHRTFEDIQFKGVDETPQGLATPGPTGP